MVIISTSATDVSIQAVSPELGEQFSSILGSQAGAGTSAGAAAVGSAGAAAGACAYEGWNVGKLKKTPSRAATMNATNPARKGSLRVMVFASSCSVHSAAASVSPVRMRTA